MECIGTECDGEELWNIEIEEGFYVWSSQSFCYKSSGFAADLSRKVDK